MGLNQPLHEGGSVCQSVCVTHHHIVTDIPLSMPNPSPITYDFKSNCHIMLYLQKGLKCLLTVITEFHMQSMLCPTRYLFFAPVASIKSHEVYFSITFI